MSMWGDLSRPHLTSVWILGEMLLLRHSNPLIRARAASAYAPTLPLLPPPLLARCGASALFSTSPAPAPPSESLAATLARHIGSDGKGLGLGWPLPPSREPRFTEVRLLRARALSLAGLLYFPALLSWGRFPGPLA